MKLFDDGRIVYDDNIIKNEDIGHFIDIDVLPTVEEISGKIGYVVADTSNKKAVIIYNDIPNSDQEPIYSHTVQELSNAEAISLLNEILLKIS